jgi:hypothetical protein
VLTVSEDDLSFPEPLLTLLKVKSRSSPSQEKVWFRSRSRLTRTVTPSSMLVDTQFRLKEENLPSFKLRSLPVASTRDSWTRRGTGC